MRKAVAAVIVALAVAGAWIVWRQRSDMALSDNLLLFLPMDEASGNADDVHSNNLDFTAFNTPGNGTGLVYATARDFIPGSGEYFARADSATISIGDVAMMVLVWVKMDDKSVSRRIIAQWDTTNNRAWFVFYDQAVDRFRFAVSGNGTTSTIVSADNFGSPSTGTWYCIMAWHSAAANTINISVNNGTADSTSHTTGVFDSNASVSIGAIWESGAVEASNTNKFDGLIGPVAIWKGAFKVDAERTQLYNGGAGLQYPLDTAITISESNATVIPFKVLQRNGSGQADITISGACVGGSTIEARFNGGTWTTIDSSTSGGTYSGTLSAQAAGRGSVEVRAAHDTAVTDSVANFGIGDVFVVAGDSISEGRGTNPQSYSGAAKVSVFRQDDAWADGNDPVDTGTNSGSHWPLLGTAFLTDQSVPIGFITTGTGSTDVAGTANQWAEPNSAYEEMEGQVAASGVNSVKAVLAHLGPNAVVNASTLSQATYNTALDTLATNIAADLAGAPPLMLTLFGEVSTGTPPDRDAALNNLRAAIIEAWDDNAAILEGPVLIDQNYTDGVHPVSDAQLGVVADRWWLALDQAFYGGTNLLAPRITSAARSGTTVTLNYDKTLAAGTTYDAFTYEDDGGAIVVSSATRTSGTTIQLALAETPSGTGEFATFADADSAVGGTVPTNAAGMPAIPQTISVTVGGLTIPIAASYYRQMQGH